VRTKLLPLVLVAAGALALSACDANFLPTAARVDGSFVSQSTLNQALDSVASDAGYRCLLESSAGANVVAGVARGTYSASFTAGALSLLIEAKAADAAIAHAGLVVGPLATTLADDELATSFSPSTGSTCTEPGTEVLASLGSSFRHALVSLQADQDVLAAHAVGAALTTTGVRAYAAQHPKETALDCTEAIEVASRAKAGQLAEAIKGGASFALVAKKNSIDASGQRGGALGCLAPSALTSPLNHVVASLSVGVLSAPVQFGGDWILFEVTSRRAPTLSEAASALVHAGTVSASQAINAAVARAHVEVDPRYGTWRKVGSTYEVRAPTGPPLRLLPNPSAVGA
jgi:hypothetical protein